MSAPAPLHGLVLAGGRSQRMRRDKAALDYHGRDQLAHTHALVASLAGECHVSIAQDQLRDPLRSRFPCIVDIAPDLGPAGGIRSAQSKAPAAAWLVVACDLPFLDANTLAGLIAARDPALIATAYRSAHDGLPEPLCAIWEPASAPLLAQWLASGKQCPRGFLKAEGELGRVRFLDPPSPRALDNANAPEEYEAAVRGIAERPASRSLQVQYFAVLREQAGRSEERLSTNARNAEQLYAELAARHGLTLPREMLRVAINDEFGEWGQPLAEGDRIVFIPPVAGG